MKKALITGITGQDGSYLAEFLLEKGYKVFGLVRRSSNDPFVRLENLTLKRKVKIIYGDLRDMAAIQRAVSESQPDEIYNLAAQSDVGISFLCPEETWEINYHGVGRLVIEAMKANNRVRIYQASTSEMFGRTPPPQNESSVFSPVSPYAEAKLRAHQDYVLNYREKNGLFICSGILFNHESPRRGKHFVTRKITHSLAKIAQGQQTHLELGNLEAKRDWGFAGDYVEAMWLMLQQNIAEDFVVATGENHSVKEFVEAAAAFCGWTIAWEGHGPETIGRCYPAGQPLIKVNPEFYRPAEVNYLLGNATKAKKILGWRPKINFQQLVGIMMIADMELVRSTLKT